MIHPDQNTGLDVMDGAAEFFELHSIFIIAGKQNDHAHERMGDALYLRFRQSRSGNITNNGTEHVLFPLLLLVHERNLLARAQANGVVAANRFGHAVLKRFADQRVADRDLGDTFTGNEQILQIR